jgi:RHS repeat-associated protein
VLTRKTRANQTIAFAYDTLNRLISKTPPAPAPVVSYSYDPLGRLTGVSDTSAAIAAPVPPAPYTRYTTHTSYDALNRPTGVTFDPAPAAATPSPSSVTFAHSYTPANQRAGQTTTDNTWWEYLPATPSTVGYTANALNQYTVVGAVMPTYDGNGNLTFDGTFSYGYDAENRLVSVTGPGLTASYAYDAQGRRKSKTVNGTTTVFVTDADNREVLEYDGATGAILRWYTYGLGSNDVLGQMNVAAATRTTFIPDLQGSIIGTMDSATATLTKFAYSPFGASATTTGTFRYTGQRIDPETAGLHYYRARMYAPLLGRFLQPDPIGYQGGANLYAYVSNDPLNLIDPLGLCDNPSGCGGRSFGERFNNYLVGGAEALASMPRSLANMAEDLVTDPLLFLHRAGPGLAGLGMSIPVVGAGAPITRSIGSIGQAGEEAVGIAANSAKVAIRIPESTTIRYPDLLTATTIEEVKNVARLSFTQQLQDYLAFAQATDRTFVLYVRPTTRLTGPLQDAVASGQITLRLIPP